MQIRCAFCQNMYAINREMELIALQDLTTNNLQHYDASCPRCRRSTRVMRVQLERMHPNWQVELAELEKQNQALPMPVEAPMPAPVIEEKKKSEHRRHHKSGAEKKVEMPAKPPAEKIVVKKTSTKITEKKPAKKPAAKSTPAKKTTDKKPASKSTAKKK